MDVFQFFLQRLKPKLTQITRTKIIFKLFFLFEKKIIIEHNVCNTKTKLVRY